MGQSWQNIDEMPLNGTLFIAFFFIRIHMDPYGFDLAVLYLIKIYEIQNEAKEIICVT